MQINTLFLLRFLVILNLMFLVQSYPSMAASPEKRVALVIGNSAYQNTPPLANPRNDATEMGKVLKRIGFDVDVVVDATKPQMDQALRRFGNNLAGSIAAVFYYAGHGIQVDGINYILPVDVTLKTERDLSWEVSDLTTVLKQMEGHNRVNLLFLDACRDNPMSQTLARSMGESRSSVIGRGLAPMKANAGTLISYSTKEGEVAADGKGKHSPYTEALLKHIEVPGVEIGLMLRKVREEVIAATKNKQVPWEYGSLLGEFYFTGPVTIQVQPKADKSDIGSKNDSLYWESIMNDTDPAAFEEYIKKYPDGEFVELAKRKINALKKGGAKPSIVDVIPQSDHTKPSGSLKISSDPTDALVLLDGNPMGNTDMEMSGIDIGKRKLEMKKDCFETKTTEVFIKANQQVILNLKLKPSCGAISVTSNPAGANILMNEKLMGVTPAELTELKDGTYTISLKKAGYEEWKDTVTVKAGKTVPVKVDRLKPTISVPPLSQQSDESKPLIAVQNPIEPRINIETTPRDNQIIDQYQKITPLSMSDTATTEDVNTISETTYLTRSLVENFNGLELNDKLWKHVDNKETVTNRKVNNGLILQATTDKNASGGIISKFLLQGDFEITVDFILEKWPENGFWDEKKKYKHFRLTLTENKSTGHIIKFHIYRTKNGEDGYGIFFIHDGKVKKKFGDVRTDKSSEGKLKLVRKNGKITAYYFSKFVSNDWKNFLEYQDIVDNPLYMALSIQNFWEEENCLPSEATVRIPKISINLQRADKR